MKLSLVSASIYGALSQMLVAASELAESPDPLACTGPYCALSEMDIEQLEMEEAGMVNIQLLQAKLVAEKVTVALPASGEQGFEATMTDNNDEVYEHTQRGEMGAEVNQSTKTRFQRVPADGTFASQQVAGGVPERDPVVSDNSHVVELAQEPQVPEAMTDLESADVKKGIAEAVGMVAAQVADEVSVMESNVKHDKDEAEMVQGLQVQDKIDESAVTREQDDLEQPSHDLKRHFHFSALFSVIALVILASFYFLYRGSSELNEKAKAVQLLQEFETSEQAKHAEAARTERLLSKIVAAAKKEEEQAYLAEARAVVLADDATFLGTEGLGDKATHVLSAHEIRHNDAAKRLEARAAEFFKEAKVAMAAKRLEDRAAKVIKEPSAIKVLDDIVEPYGKDGKDVKEIEQGIQESQDEPDGEPEGIF